MLGGLSVHHKLKDLQLHDTWESVLVLDNFVIGGSFIGDDHKL